MDGFAQGLNNGYIRQRIHEINMDKYKVIIVDDDDVAHGEEGCHTGHNFRAHVGLIDVEVE